VLREGGGAGKKRRRKTIRARALGKVIFDDFAVCQAFAVCQKAKHTAKTRVRVSDGNFFAVCQHTAVC
jgi:hypothetical protein